MKSWRSIGPDSAGQGGGRATRGGNCREDGGQYAACVKCGQCGESKFRATAHDLPAGSPDIHQSRDEIDRHDASATQHATRRPTNVGENLEKLIAVRITRRKRNPNLPTCDSHQRADLQQFQSDRTALGPLKFGLGKTDATHRTEQHAGD